MMGEKIKITGKTMITDINPKFDGDRKILVDRFQGRCIDDPADDIEIVDDRGPAVIVLGGLLGGFQLYGPFDTVTKASDFYRDKTISGMLKAGGATIMLLLPPDQIPGRIIEREEFNETIDITE